MEYGRPVQFGVLNIPKANQHGHPLEMAVLGDRPIDYIFGGDDPQEMRRFASGVAVRVSEAVAAAG